MKQTINNPKKHAFKHPKQHSDAPAHISVRLGTCWSTCTWF